MPIKPSRTYCATYRADAVTQDSIKWISAALGQIMPGSRISNSTIIRRAINLYVTHLEHVLGSDINTYSKPRLIHSEAYAISQARQEQRTPWDQMPQEALYVDGVFQPYSRIVKAATKALPSALDRLVQECPPVAFSRRAD